MDFLFIQFAHMRYNLSSLCANAQSTLDTQRKVSEDPKDFAFLRIIQSLAYYRIQVSRFPHISQRFWFPADCPISCIFTVYIQCTLSLCIFAAYAYIAKILLSCGLSNLLHITVYKYQGSRIYVCIVQSFLLYTSIKSSKEFPAYSWVLHSCLTTRGGNASYLRTVIVTAAVYWGFSR